MLRLAKRIGISAVASLAVVALATPVNAQGFVPIYPGGPTYGQYLNNIRALGQAYQSVPPYLLGYNPYQPRVVNYGGMYPGYGGYGGYGGYDGSLYGYYGNPYAGYLQGAASVIRAQGRYNIEEQQSFLVREQVRAERLKNRRSAFDEYMYEKQHTPTPQEQREAALAMELRRALNDPPVNEILSAKALNDILSDLKKQTSRAVLTTVRGTGPKDQAGPRVALDDDVMRHINVTGTTGGTVGLLKNGGRLNFPLALSGDDYKAERERLSTLAQDVVKDAEFNNRIDAGSLKQMLDDVDRLQRQLSRSVGELSPAQYIEAKRFLNNLSDALNTLSRPDATNYFNRNWAAKGRSVEELVKHMADKGLTFAPAVAGDEAYYVALHRALTSYLQSMQGQGQVAVEPAPKESK